MLLGWTRILGATCFRVWYNLDYSCKFGKCWLGSGTPLILDIAYSIRKMMSRAWNATNWTPDGGLITSLWYVCMYACLWRKSNLSILSKSVPKISIPIEWRRSLADWCIGCPFLPKKWYFANFLRNGAYNFFILGIRIENINTYQLAKTAFKLVHFFGSYSPKTGLMTSSFGLIQQGEGTRWAKSIILLYFDEQGGQASVWGLHSSPWLGQTSMIQSLPYRIRPQAQMGLKLIFIEIACLFCFTKP